MPGCADLYAPTAPDGNWRVDDTPRYALHVRPGSFCASQAAAVGELLEDQYAHTVDALALRSSARVSVFLYDSRTELSPMLPSDRSGVAFPDTGAVHAVCVPPLDDSLRALLTHEANHVIVNQGLGRAGTSFMNEGLASALISERLAPIGPSFLFAWTAAQRTPLPRIATLVDDRQWSSSSQAGYNTSASFLAWLLQAHGRDRLKQLYYARSSEMAARAVEIYARSLDTLESEWLAFAGSRTTNVAP